MHENGTRLPLEGVRVLDLTHRLAGPTLTMILGDWGADVLKLEWWQRMDAWRGMISVEHDRDGQKSYNKRPNWLKLNRNKRSITLNLKTEAGKSLFLELVRHSDVVADNFSARVLERLGLGYERLSVVNPRIVMISMPGFGASGPHEKYVSNGATIEGYAGLASLTGYEDGVPRNSVGIWPDPVAGVHGAVAVAMALVRRHQTGRGQNIDLSQAEALVNMIGEAVLDYTVNGHVQTPMGNSDQSMCPHGVYPCSGDDRWISIAVWNDTQWDALCEVIEDKALLSDERFRSIVSRLKCQTEIDERLAMWTAPQDAWELAARLQAAGVPATPVANQEEVTSRSDLPSRRFHVKFDHPHQKEFPGPAARLNGQEPAIRVPPPDLGSNNEDVFRDLLGLSDAQLAGLRDAGVI